MREKLVALHFELGLKRKLTLKLLKRSHSTIQNQVWTMLANEYTEIMDSIHEILEPTTDGNS